jgi:hypothetical protein
MMNGTPCFSKTAGSQTRVAAIHPEKDDLLLYGYIGGGDLLRGTAAIVEPPLGAGRVIFLAPDVLCGSPFTGGFMFSGIL